MGKDSTIGKLNMKYIKQIFSVLTVAFVVGACVNKSEQVEVETASFVKKEKPADPTYEYGMQIDSFKIHRGVIQRNQFLSEILLKHHVPYPEIDRLVKRSKPIFDVRKIASGKNYAVFCEKGAEGKAQCFIYEPSPTEYIVFDMRDSIEVHKGEKPVEIREATVAGVINSSLYNALTDANTSPALAMELSEMYAWSIDFYRIQKGDKFKVVYEQKYVDDEFIGVGEVKAALFNHRSEDFYGFYFEQDSAGAGDYFDQNAKSLRKAFLQAPLKFSRISSGFTMRRFHPVQKRYKAHLGTDYAAPKGTPIMAVGDGVVTEARFKKFNGNYVKIKHNGTYTTQYLHMSGFASGIKSGKMVRQGDIIGYVGSTGLATGPHVCFRFWKNGKQVDHRKEKLPPSLPVKPENMERFQQHMDVLKELLDGIPFEAPAQA